MAVDKEYTLLADSFQNEDGRAYKRGDLVPVRHLIGEVRRRQLRAANENVDDYLEDNVSNLIRAGALAPANTVNARIARGELAREAVAPNLSDAEIENRIQTLKAQLEERQKVAKEIEKQGHGGEVADLAVTPEDVGRARAARDETGSAPGPHEEKAKKEAEKDSTRAEAQRQTRAAASRRASQ